VKPGDVYWFDALDHVWYVDIRSHPDQVKVTLYPRTTNQMETAWLPRRGWLTVVSVETPTPGWITFLYHGKLCCETVTWVVNQVVRFK
jgi:hypothetical protein